MTQDINYTTKTKQLIDNLKSVCANYGLGNDGNEFKIISQVFLYKFLSDKYNYEIKKLRREYGEDYDLDLLLDLMDENVPKFQEHQQIEYLYNIQNTGDFAKTFDDTLRQISIENADVFSVKSYSGAKDTMFDELSQFITDPSQRDDFCRALINKLFEFSFEASFEDYFDEKYDFFKDIFEYLIKDYNSDSGGKYAEYYTPNAVARIIAKILVPEQNVKKVSCYDPSVGSGSLLMSLAHQIGETNCTLYSEDISQKSSAMMRLNLILNNLTHSIPNVIRTNSIAQPAYLNEKFDYIVSNPPFKLDFSDFRDDLEKDAFKKRFFAGIPRIPKKKKDSMSIYLLFIQHIMHSLSDKGKAAIVVPTGFITAQSGIEKKIRQKLVKNKMLAGVVSMPSNIFATTGTNVSIIFIDKENKGDVVLIDASNLGTKVKEGKNQKTVLSHEEEQQIIETFNKKEAIDDFSVVVSYDEIKAKNYSLSAGQYFEIKIEYVDITVDEFKSKMNEFESNLESLFEESKSLEKEIQENLKALKYD